MAHLLYFVEGAGTLNREHAARLGLGYALGDGLAQAAVNGKGPGGNPGVCACKSAERMGYHPDRQTWLRIPRIGDQGKGRPATAVFVGVWNDSPPTPAELQRPKLLPGWPVKLLDGNEWVAATAYQWHEQDASEDGAGGPPRWSYALPAHAEIDSDGSWRRGRVHREYERLWAIAKAHFDILVGAADESPEVGDVELNAADTRDLAAEVLGVNYRVSKWECALLGLFDDPPILAAQVLRATVGLPAIEAWQKKRTLAVVGGSSGSAGEAA